MQHLDPHDAPLCKQSQWQTSTRSFTTVSQRTDSMAFLSMRLWFHVEHCADSAPSTRFFGSDMMMSTTVSDVTFTGSRTSAFPGPSSTMHLTVRALLETNVSFSHIKA